MQIKHFTQATLRGRISGIRVHANSCGPMVLEVVHQTAENVTSSLLKDRHQHIITYHTLADVYKVCRKAGIRQAELCQQIAHAEACGPTNAPAIFQTMPLAF